MAKYKDGNLILDDNEQIELSGKILTEISNDETLSDNSSASMVTEFAIKTYIDTNYINRDGSVEFISTQSFGDNNITNVGDISLDSLTKDDGGVIDINNDTAFGNDVNIVGNLTINGDKFQSFTEHVSATDNIITINAGSAGIEVDRGTQEPYHFKFIESNDTFSVGVTGDMQAVATRQDAPQANGVSYWNDTDKRLDTSSNFIFDGTKLGIGTSNPQTPMHFKLGGTDTDLSSDDRIAGFQNSANADDNSFMTFLSGNEGKTGIYMGDTDNDAVAQLSYNNYTHNYTVGTNDVAGTLKFYTSTFVETMRMDFNSRLYMGGYYSDHIYLDDNQINCNYNTNDEASLLLNYHGYQAGTTQFRDTIIHDGKENAILTVDGSSGNVGIGIDAPWAKADVHYANSSTTLGGGKAGVRIFNTDTTNYNHNYLQFNSAGNSTGIINLTVPNHTNNYSVMSFATRGSDGLKERMYLTNSGRLGIGTDNCGNKLHIYVDDTSTGHTLDGNQIIIEQDSSTGDAGIQLELTGGQAYSMYLDNTDDKFKIRDITNSKNPFVYNPINQDVVFEHSNVGIGRTPIADLDIYRSSGDAIIKLESVTGGDSTITLKGGTNRTNIINFEDQDGIASRITYDHSNNSMNFLTNGISTVDMIIDGSGNVGIGGITPTKTLHVEKDVNDDLVKFVNSRTTDGQAYGMFVQAGSTSADYAMRVKDHDSTNDLFRISGNGNIGVGSNTPSNVMPDSWANNAGSNALQISARSSSYDAGLFVRNSADTQGVDIWHDGNSNIAYIDSLRDSDNGDLIFRSKTVTASPIETMRIKGNGKIGIGISAPDAKLHVSGGDIASDVTSAQLVSNGNNINISLNDGNNYILSVYQKIQGLNQGKWTTYMAIRDGYGTGSVTQLGTHTTGTNGYTVSWTVGGDQVQVINTSGSSSYIGMKAIRLY